MNISSLATAELDVVGNEALDLHKLAGSGAKVPEAFVLTSSAFDDFITAAGIVDKIMQQLETIRPGNQESINQASTQIQNLILQANFPSIVLGPLMQAYKSLSGFTDKYVQVSASWVLPTELRPEAPIDFVRKNVKGEAALLYAIKQIWCALFSPESVAKRVNNIYQGGLSVAVIVQKMVHAEVSGRVYSRDPITGDSEHIVVEALLGLLDSSQSPQESLDVYKVERAEMLIKEKNIAAQDRMVLRRGQTSASGETTIQVAISAEWRRKQKLDDSYVLALARMCIQLDEAYGDALELEWSYDTGSLYITAVSRLQPLQLMPDVDQLDLTGMLIPISEPDVEIMKASPDLDKLVDEVQELAATTAEQPEPLAELEVVEEETADTAASAKMVKLELDQPLTVTSKLLTNLYLDISDMETGKLANLTEYKGGLFDGSSMVAGRAEQASELMSDKPKLNALIDTYALEISSASRAVAGGELFYQFSNLSGNDALAGSERFLAHPEALLVELLAVKRARSIYEAKHVHLVLPALRSEQQLVDLKKILLSQDFKRSNNAMLLAEVSQPLFVHQLESLGKRDLDGLLVNLPLLATNLFGREQLYAQDIQALKGVLQHLTQQAQGFLPVYVRLHPVAQEVQLCLEQGLDNLIFTDLPDVQTLHQVQQAEQGKVIKKRQRGRPLKRL